MSITGDIEMRVLVHGLVGNNLGGIETYLLNMNDAMSDNCIFDYVVEENICIHAKRIQAKGGKLYKVRPRATDPIGNTIDIIKLYKKHKKEYRTIYYNLSSLSWLIPEIISKIMGYRIVVHAHNAMLIDANRRFIHRSMNKINKKLLAAMNVKRLACSQYASRFIFGNKKSEIIYNGIDVESYKYSEIRRKIIREKYGINKNTFVIGTVGRLAYQKDPLFTIDIFNEFQKSIPDSILLMFGEGKLRSEIDEKANRLGIHNKVMMPGIVPNICETLNAMDVFLLPSRHEGLGIALIEAQANGLPCFTSKSVVPKEAKVTDLLSFCDRAWGCKKWSDVIKNNIRKFKNNNRAEWNEIVKISGFSLSKESKKLEFILCDRKVKNRITAEDRK
jgi:glycosyltransferase involved in cell wall biosynthesis